MADETVPTGTRRVLLRSPRQALEPAEPPPPPPRRRRRPGLLSSLSAFLTFAVVASVALGGGALVARGQYFGPGPLGADKVVIVPSGGRQDTIDLLEREGVIAQPLLMTAALAVAGSGKGIKRGEYLFRQNASLADVVDTLTEGRSIAHTVTIPEGLTSEQIVGRLMESDLLEGAVKQAPREGTLLPETYKFERGTSRDVILSRMASEHRRLVADVWSRRSPELSLRTPAELVTMASVVEKETGRADERTRVAAVFLNRLARNMRLQSDPTVIYGVVGGKGTLGRGLTRAELDTPTPFNTYAVPGLPAGPIANPGRASLEAVANPSRTRDLFFVADGTGGHAFAETYEQHQRNVARWRQIEGQARDVPAPAAPAPPPGQRTEAPAGAAPSAFAPVDPDLFAADPSAPDSYPVPAGRRAAAPGRGRNNVDAAAGTSRDPLLNRTFDLNSPKTVPALR